MTQRVAVGVLVFGLIVVVAGDVPAGPRGKLADEMAGPWQLFVDDEIVASKTNVQRRYHSFQKHRGNPIITVDRPWEEGVVAAFTVLQSEDGSGYRMYYTCWTPKGSPSRSLICYATSTDGLHWEKPNLGLHEWNGSRENNILPEGPSAVMRTAWEHDPEKRFQGVGGMYHAVSSPDGIHWKRQTTENNVSGGGDTSHFYFDPKTRTFRANVKVNATVSGLRRRAIGFAETTDLNRFPPLRLIMAPDDLDDRWCRPGSVQRTHFYACPVMPYESIYVGLLQIYRAEDPEGYFHGPLWLELVTSRDGIHFRREEGDRPPLLSLGKFRTFDHGMVFALPPIVVGDELWLYYTGYDELHDLLPYHSAIGLAKLRKDGFVSLDADEAPGGVLTTRLDGATGPLVVNCDARGGSLRVEVLDAQGTPIPGYSLDDCEPRTGDSLRHAVVWNDHRTLPEGTAPIRLRFHFERARLYSFLAGEHVKPVADEPGSVLQALYTFEGKHDAWADMLADDGLQPLQNLGTCTLDTRKPDPAFGERSLIVGSEWRPWNRVEVLGTGKLGRRFTLAAMVKSRNNKLARLFSAYSGNFPTNTSELLFDFDPRGRVIAGLRLYCKGIPVESDPLTFDDGKYHHLAVVYDDGAVTFYLDGKPAGERSLPGGEPVSLARNLLVGEDAALGSDEQLMGHVDDLLVLGRPLGPHDVAVLARDGAAALFGAGPTVPPLRRDRVGSAPAPAPAPSRERR